MRGFIQLTSLVFSAIAAFATVAAVPEQACAAGFAGAAQGTHQSAPPSARQSAPPLVPQAASPPRKHDATPAATPDKESQAAKANAVHEAKPDAKPDAKQDAKPAATADAKPDATVAAKPDAKHGATTAAKPDAKPDAKQGATTEHKPAEAESPAPVHPKAASKDGPASLSDVVNRINQVVAEHTAKAAASAPSAGSVRPLAARAKVRVPKVLAVRRRPDVVLKWDSALTPGAVALQWDDQLRPAGARQTGVGVRLVWPLRTP